MRTCNQTISFPYRQCGTEVALLAGGLAATVADRVEIRIGGVELIPTETSDA